MRKSLIPASFACAAMLGLVLSGCGKGEETTGPSSTMMPEAPAQPKQQASGAMPDLNAYPAPAGVQAGDMTGGAAKK